MTLNFAALDVETANPTRASICSFGVAIVRDGQVTEKHHLLTMPPAGLNTFAPIQTGIHGLTAADVAGEPAFDVRLKEVLLLIGDLPVVAHNASFDFGAIRAASEVALIPIPALTYGCTLAMSRHADLSLSKYSLPAVCEALGIDQGHHHRADDDAEAAARIVLALMSLRGIETLAELTVALNVNFLSLNEPDGSRLSGVSARSGY